MFMFEFYRNLNGYIPLIILIPNFMGFFVLTGTGMTLSIISCISSVDSSPNLLFFCRWSLASHEKILCQATFAASISI